MLTALSIRNLAVIESVQLSFRSGFHVLTGETGAGKSIIIDALSLIAGGRGSSELVRYGSDKAEMEATFDVSPDHPVWSILERLGIDADPKESLIVRREINAQGKSVSRVNGQMVNQTMLREIGDALVNIHGQHEHQSLLKTEEHIHWLDVYGGADITKAKAVYAACYDQYEELSKRLRELQETGKQALQMLDLYRFQVEEIAAAGLKPDEDQALQEERKMLANAEKRHQAVHDAYETIYGSGKGIQGLAKAVQKLQDAAGFDPQTLNPIVEQLQSAYYQLEDASFTLRDYRDGIEFNVARLDQIEERLDLISSFRRKYGNTVEEILQYYEQIRRELDLIDNKDEAIRQLQKELDDIHSKLAERASRLSKLRQTAGKRLAEAIEAELKELHMERTRIHVQIERTADDRGVEVDGQTVRVTRDGIDKVEFLISPNPGEPLRGLAKIASGGELSRIMLAMKAIFAESDRIPVLVFDEVDTGVSGRAAQAIAEKLSRLSRHCQVFSITHLPQVASAADVHFLIHKSIKGERTYTEVNDLQNDDRVQELARMLGGVQVTETTLGHAREMLQMAAGNKLA